MKFIHLGKDKFTCVDDGDYEEISKYLWKLSSQGYARGGRLNKSIFLHRFLLGVPPVGFVIDHINRDKLDNRRSNLRFATHSENIINRGLPLIEMYPTLVDIEQSKKLRDVLYSSRSKHFANLNRLNHPETYDRIRKSIIKEVRNKHTGVCYESATQAARELGLRPNHILECCAGHRVKHGGFEWEYYNIGPLG